MKVAPQIFISSFFSFIHCTKQEKILQFMNYLQTAESIACFAQKMSEKLERHMHMHKKLYGFRFAKMTCFMIHKNKKTFPKVPSTVAQL